MFPFTVFADDTPHYTSSPYDFRSAYEAARNGMSGGFAYNVVVNSPTEITFQVFGMRDTCYGGIGKHLWDIDATVSPEITKNAIRNQAYDMARFRRAKELQEAEDRLIDGYVDEIIKAID